MMFPVLIGWIISVPLDIWWPRPVSPEHPGLSRAYTMIRMIAALILLSYGLCIVVAVQIQGGAHIGLGFLGAVLSGGAFMLSPLAACASALDVQRRSLAVFGSYATVLLAAGLGWYSLMLWAYILQAAPEAPFWWTLCALASALIAAVAVALVLELYTMVRRPTASQ